MTRYRLRRLVLEEDADGVWVGALPHGPVLHVSGSGELVLDVLGAWDRSSDAPAPELEAAEIACRVEAELGEVPDGAAAIIADFLAQLARAGVVETVEDPR